MKGPTVEQILAMRPRSGASWAADRAGVQLAFCRNRNPKTGRWVTVKIWCNKPGYVMPHLWIQGHEPNPYIVSTGKRPNWVAIRNYLLALEN